MVPPKTRRTPGSDRPPSLAEVFSLLERSTRWTRVDRHNLDFSTFHPQGMALVKDLIFLSSVEIIEPTVRFPELIGGYDRSPGQGRGHLFVITRTGELIKEVVVGEGSAYHPGGIDFDGRRIWLPVAQYRPNGHTIVYTVDPDTLEVTEQFRHDDHVGGVIFDRQRQQPTGFSWGSRTFFSWDRDGRLQSSRRNPSHFVDYQDGQYAGAGRQLCTGLTTLTGAEGDVDVGGAALVDLASGRILHEVPIAPRSTAGHPITRNPVAFETDGDTLRMFAAPDDGDAVAGTQLYLFETRPEAT